MKLEKYSEFMNDVWVAQQVSQHICILVILKRSEVAALFKSDGPPTSGGSKAREQITEQARRGLLEIKTYEAALGITPDTPTEDFHRFLRR